MNSSVASSATADLAAAETYIERMHEVEGWFTPASARTICVVHRIQRELGITGDVFEIGVHHGKSALLLSCLIDPQTEWLGVNDLFGSQDANVSQSGGGDRQVFESNLARMRPTFDRIRIFEQPSATLTIHETGARCRLFHIDGGHSSDETFRDLVSAAAALHESGVILVDDYFNQDFPGVSEGVNRFLFRDSRFRPFLLAFNKVYLCPTPLRSLYVDRIQSSDLREAFRLAVTPRVFYDAPVLTMRDVPEPGDVGLRIAVAPAAMILPPESDSTVELLVENVGKQVVNGAAGWAVALDHHLYRGEELVRWDNRRTSFSPLQPGESQRVAYPIRSPATHGRYRLVFESVIENVGWLPNADGSRATLHMTVQDLAGSSHGAKPKGVESGKDREEQLLLRAETAERHLAEVSRLEHELRRQVEQYVAFQRSLEESLSWRVLQSLRRLFGRAW